MKQREAGTMRSKQQDPLEWNDPAGFLSRLQEWRDTGASPDVAYCAGNNLFAQDVTALLAEVERLRRKQEHLVSILNGISRQTAEVVRAHS